jgi:hypothetical protein
MKREVTELSGKLVVEEAEVKNQSSLSNKGELAY